MNHSFDVDIAKQYGVECAIILYHIDFWIQKNEANGKHFHDGKYWTYNSIKAFAELFPYWSESQINRILKKLEDAELISVGNYNHSSYDRTKWYSLNRKLHLTKSQNGFDEIVKPIPYINTDINTDTNMSDDSIDWNALLVFFNKTTGNKSRVVNEKVKKQFRARLKEGYTKEDIMKAIINCHKDPFHQANPHYLTLEFISRADKLEKYSNYKPKVVRLPEDWFHRELTPEQKEMLTPERLSLWKRNKQAVEMEGGRLKPIEV